jgi:hypothetical protein
LSRPDLLGLVRQFALDGEANIPTWYQSTALLICSALLAIIAACKRAGRDPFTLHWKAMAIIFLFLSIDETALLHDMINEVVRKSGVHIVGAFYYVWVIPFGLFVLIFLISYLRFLVHLPPKIRRMFIAAGAIYVVGALGMEVLEGLYRSTYWKKDLPYMLMSTFEETLEMTGIVIFIYALTTYITSVFKDIKIDFINA